MAKKSLTNQDFFEQEHPQEYAKLLNMVQRGSSIYDCQVRLTEKKVIIETESFTNIQKMKKHKLNYAPGVANELEAMYDRLASQKRTMFYPYYSWLVQLVDKHLKDKGITLVMTDGPAILKDSKNDQEKVYRFNREDYNNCLSRIFELLAHPQQPNNNTRINNNCAWLIWENMEETERKNVYSRLNSEDREILKECLKISGYDENDLS